MRAGGFLLKNVFLFSFSVSLGGPCSILLVYLWAFPGFSFMMNIFLLLIIQKKKKERRCWVFVNNVEKLPKALF